MIIKGDCIFVSVLALANFLSGHTHAAEVVHFNMLNDLPPGASTWQQPLAMSSDGSVIALHGDSGVLVAPRGWVWSQAGEFEPVPNHHSYPYLVTVSGDGNVVAAQNSNPSGATSTLWNREDQEVTALEMGVRLLSGDGTVAAGFVDSVDPFGFLQTQAIRWSEASGVESLGISSEWSRQVPLGMSADARTIVGSLAHGRIQTPGGWRPWRADGFIWREGNVVELGLPHMSGSSALALDVTADGTTVLARAGQELLQLDSDGELLRSLGVFPGFEEFEVLSDVFMSFMSSDGDVVLGPASTAVQIDGAFHSEGFMWDEANGYRKLSDAFRDDHGITFPADTKFIIPTAISDDKKVIAGWRKNVQGFGPPVGWVAYLDRPIDAAPIPGDYNNNGVVEQADLDLVLLNWGEIITPAGWLNEPPHGAIDQEELDGVLLCWGNTSSSVAAATVPEPSAFVLLLLGVAILPLVPVRQVSR